MRYAIFETDGEPVLLREDEISSDDILALAVNCKATATFYIFPSFESWQKCKRTLTYVRIIDSDLAEDRIIFRGRVLIVTDNMDSSGRMWQELTCFSAADFLDDTAHTTAIAYQPLESWLAAVQNAHNGAVDTARQLTLSVASGLAKVGSDDKKIIKTNYQTLTEVLTGGDYLWKIVEGGVTAHYKMEWRERCENDAAYIDIAQSFGTAKDTPIVLGENLKDIKVERNTDGGVYTSVLAVSGVNSDGSQHAEEAYNAEMRALYGTERVKIVEAGDIRCTAPMYSTSYSGGSETPSPTAANEAMQRAVYAYAVQEAAKLSDPPMKITLNAVDLARLGLAGYDGFEVGNSHPVVCPPLGLYGEAMRITGLKRRLATGQIASIVIEKGQTPGSRSAGNLSYYIAKLDEANRESVDTEIAQTEIAATQAEEQSGGYITTDITQEDYDDLPATSKLKTHGFCVIRDPDTGEVTNLIVGGKNISSEGGGGTIEYAAILSSEEMTEWAPQHELTPLWFRGSATVYYGQAPARFVVQNNRVLWGTTTPVENDIASEMTFELANGTIRTYKSYIYQTAARTSQSGAYIAVFVGIAQYDDGVYVRAKTYTNGAVVPLTASRVRVGLYAAVTEWAIQSGELRPRVNTVEGKVFVDGVDSNFGTTSSGSVTVPGYVPCSNAERDFGLALTTTTEPIAP